jgi:hypothetical protein
MNRNAVTTLMREDRLPCDSAPQLVRIFIKIPHQ